MLCQVCKERSATIHLTEINNGQRAESHLCQQCAQQQGLSIKAKIPLDELMNTLLSSQQEKAAQEGKTLIASESDHACPNCGMTLKRFAQNPLLGCSQDYTEFQAELLPLIAQSHNGQTHHCGKVPTRIGEHDRNEIQRNKLSRQLDQAVKNEDYETAAKLRDQIQALA